MSLKKYDEKIEFLRVCKKRSGRTSAHGYLKKVRSKLRRIRLNSGLSFHESKYSGGWEF